MKLHKLDKNQQQNVHITRDEKKEFLRLWHCHHEHEIVYIENGEGTLYVGDYIGDFKSGQFYYFGKNLPHMFQSYKNSNEHVMSTAYAIHINEELFKIFNIFSTELSFLNHFLEMGKTGVQFHSKNTDKLLPILKNMTYQDVQLNTIATMNIIVQVMKNWQCMELSSREWLKTYDTSNRRLNKVIQYIMQNFQQNISLEEISEISGMNKTAFCRYFKAHTKKSFVMYLNEIRLNYACKLLKETAPAISISEACYLSGFNSMSYFNRIFKKHHNIPPSTYQKQNAD